ncbi:Hypothetical_protein [Hexamita inflata]|uniref:Hypothetical_protein n=1 Tax=Hexamita inflata TaxID=28002 RepID=A0AA86RF90_9EUKA|nr:Hypothetical protein HINF_LOCUS65044 [Hexamita inflata]
MQLLQLTIQCYYLLELDIYRNYTLLNARQPLISGVVDLNPKLQILCNSQLALPIVVTCYNRNNKAIATFSTSYPLFPKSFEFPQLENKDSIVSGNQAILQATYSVSFQINGEVMYTTSLARVNLKEDLVATTLIKKFNWFWLIIGIVITLILLIVFAITVYYRRKHQTTINPLYDPEDIKARFNNANKFIYKSNVVLTKSYVQNNSQNNSQEQQLNNESNDKQNSNEQLVTSKQVEFRGTIENPLKIKSVLPEEPEENEPVLISSTVEKIDIDSFFSSQILKGPEYKRPLGKLSGTRE